MKGSWQLPVYPLSLDLSADGGFMVYGYSHSSCCVGGQYSFARGSYARPTAASSAGAARHQRHGGAHAVRIAHDRAHGRRRQRPGLGLQRGLHAVARHRDLRSQPAPDRRGRRRAAWSGWSSSSGRTATQTTGKIALISVSGVDQPPTFPAAVDCYLPATGVAKDVSLSQDATRVAWSDDDGLKVAGTPSTVADPCVLSAPAVLIAPKGARALDRAARSSPRSCPRRRPRGGGTGAPVAQPPAATPAAPTATVPARVHARRAHHGPRDQGQDGRGRARSRCPRPCPPRRSAARARRS